MGASESTARTNGTANEDEENRPQASSMGVALAAAGVAAWGISRMLSDNTDNQQNQSAMNMNGTTNQDEENRPQASSMGGGEAVAALAAAGVAAWGISRMLSDNTDNQQNQNAMNMNGRSSTTLLESENKYLPNMRPTRITWSPPPLDRFKMNTDGACRPDWHYKFDNDNVDRGPSGCGGILRDHRGNWIRGLYEYLGEMDCLTAEFHGIYNGLLLLDRLGLKEAILEADSTGAVGWITQDANNRRQRPKIIDECWNMIMECKRLIVKNKISVISCPREANKCADKLASMAIEKREGYKEIMSVPDEIKSIVDQESKMA